jgi:hypothetical protein
MVKPYRPPPVRIPALQLAFVGAALGVILAAPCGVAGDPAIEAIVNQVSSSDYQMSHLVVENMGLGYYGGPGYNMGYRNRDGWAGPGSLGNQETRLYLQDAFADMGLQVSLQGTYRNVIGELPGTTTPENVYIIGAHYDHISGDRPGGDDNASGTAGVLESARVLSQYQFESTIRFVGFNAEEDGLLGSKNYVQDFVIPNGENIVGMVNLDMILRPGWDSDLAAPIDLDLGTRTSHAASVAWAHKYRLAAADYVPTLAIDTTTFNVNGGSDQDPFVLAGCAAFLAIENTAQEIGLDGSNAYYHTYHDASDRLANDHGSPSGVTYDYVFATDVTQTVVALVAQEAVLLTPGCDFDSDLACDIYDLNTMLAEGPIAPGVTVTPGVNDQFDLTGDGVINLADLDAWLADAATANGFASPYKRADGNLDGIVDGLDFFLWNGGKFTSTLLWDRGDFNGDGVADGRDFFLWDGNKFTSSDFASVPEPSGMLLVVAMILLGAARKRR